METFKANNPQILKAIKEYLNGDDESRDKEEGNRDYTQEINENFDDYNFCYENCLNEQTVI